MYEFFEHTADIGLRVRAETCEAIFVDAARGVFALMIENLEAVRPIESWQFSLCAERLDDLLHDWLDELLYTFHSRHIACVEFEVHLSDGRLEAIARGEPIDRSRHQIGMEIKAITYHALKIEREEGGWCAEVIVDI